MRQAVGKVREEKRRSLGHELWRVFSKGNPAERENVFDSARAEEERLSQKRPDEQACCTAFEYLSVRPADVFLDPTGDLWRFAESHHDASQHLLLALRGRSGCEVYATGYTLARPAGWRAPYGLK